MNHALVGAVVEADKVLLPVRGSCLDVHGVSVVLGHDVAASGGQAQHGNVVSVVSVLELDGLDLELVVQVVKDMMSGNLLDNLLNWATSNHDYWSKQFPSRGHDSIIIMFIRDMAPSASNIMIGCRPMLIIGGNIRQRRDVPVHPEKPQLIVMLGT